MLPGGTTQEVTQLNIESLWSGGPFQDPVRITVCGFFQRADFFAQLYNGGNKVPSQQTQMAEHMQSIREAILFSPTGKIDGMFPPFCLVRLRHSAIKISKAS